MKILKTLKSIFKPLWSLLIGGGMLAAGGWLIMPHLEETVLTVSVIVGISLVAIGASKLADVF